MHTCTCTCTFFKLQTNFFGMKLFLYWKNSVKCLFTFYKQTDPIIYVREFIVFVCARCVYFNCFYLKSLVVHFYFSMPFLCVMCWCICNQQTTSFFSVWTVKTLNRYRVDFRLLRSHCLTMPYSMHYITITNMANTV